jgi:hypothetical protein
MPVRANTLRAAVLCFSTLLPAAGRAEGIDTEHLFGFMIGSDVGEVGEREIQSQTTARLSKSGGTYRAVTQELELELVPARNFRVEFGGTLASYNINGVAGFEDRRQTGLQGASLDLRYKFLDRDTAPFGLIVGAETHADRLNETTAATVRSYGTDFTLGFDRELVPNQVVAALNLLYQPQWTRFVGSGVTQQDSTTGVAAAVMAQVQPGLFLGGEARYLRKYDSLGWDEFAGHALFVGPTAFIKLSERARLTLAWSVQAWGHTTGTASALNLIDFERHQARLIFGVNF